MIGTGSRWAHLHGRLALWGGGQQEEGPSRAIQTVDLLGGNQSCTPTQRAPLKEHIWRTGEGRPPGRGVAWGGQQGKAFAVPRCSSSTAPLQHLPGARCCPGTADAAVSSTDPWGGSRCRGVADPQVAPCGPWGEGQRHGCTQELESPRRWL